MPWYFVTFLIMAVIAVVGAAIWKTAKAPQHGYQTDFRIVGRSVTVVFAALALLFLIISTTTIVSTRNVGVITTFGKPTGTLGNGFHLIAPWAKVTEMDGAVQIDWHKDNDPNGDNHDGALVVRLGNNSNAWVDTSVRWEIKQDAADDLFLQYKTFDNVRTNLVTRNLQVALNDVFASYNPLATTDAADPAAAATPTESRLPELAEEVTKALQAKVGEQVTIFEVQIPTIAFDGKTQERIDELNRQKAATAVAKESLATAQEQNRANEELAKSVGSNPNVLVSKCLDIVREKGGSVFGCWPGSTAVPTVPAGQ